MTRWKSLLCRGPHPWVFLPAFAISAGLFGGCDGASDTPSPENATNASSPEESPEMQNAADDNQTPPTGDASADAQASATLPVVGFEDIQAIIDEAARNDRVLVIDFWATWCVPCVAMFPDLHTGLKERGEDVRPVSVTLDGPDAEAKAVAFLQKHNAMKDAYRVEPVGEVQARIVDELGDQWVDVVIPAILVFDRDGRLAGEFLEGGQATVRAILERVDELIADEAS